MDDSKALLDAAERNNQTAMSKVIPCPKIEIACCQNSVTCASDAECKNIVQSCDAKVTSTSDTQKEPVKTTVPDNTKPIVPNNTDSKTTNNSNPTSSPSKSTDSSSSNTNLIVGIISCYLFLIIIIFMVMKK